MATRQIYSVIFALTLLCNCFAFNLYKSNHPTRKTTALFERLSYHEIISFTHNQFHKIDHGGEPIYPMNGRLEFDAFGRHYSLLIRKNVELFSDSFKQELHQYNESTNSMDKFIVSTEIPQCYFTAEVEYDTWSKGGVFSACKGEGISGWIHAFNETVVIRPKRFLMDVTFKGQHKISDDHLIYKYHHLDRSDYPHNHGPTCGHDHPDEDTILQQLIDKYQDTDPSRIEWIKQQQNVKKLIQQQVQQHDNDIHEHILDMHQQHPRPYHHGHNRRRLAGDKTRYVELAVVNDPAMMLEYGNDQTLLQKKSISIVSTLQKYYLDTEWGSPIGTIQIVLSAIIYITAFGALNMPSSTDGGIGSLYGKNPVNEVSYGDYLEKFQNYRAYHLSDYDNAQLFSYYDFQQSVIGYAALPGMCISSSSGGIEQCTYDDEYNGNIVAHEMGHNFYMQHDGNGNQCDQQASIMASVGSPQGFRPNSFSSCSINYADTFFTSLTYSHTLKCLDNKPTETSYAQCRNGFVEAGESCDCGESNCAAIDPCCDGSICALYASSQCSNNDICCDDCQVKGSGTVCRELDTANPCDKAQEVCDGTSPECPPDLKEVEGATCDSGDSFGYCYAGQCKSLEAQCKAADETKSLTVPRKECSTPNYPMDWQVNDNRCNNNIWCENTANSNCLQISGEKPDDGIPCNQTDIYPSQCVGGICKYSTDIPTYVWTVHQWTACNVSCKDAKTDPAGYQTREVSCTLQDGTIETDETKCDPNENNPKPSSGRQCNNFICNFCQKQPDGSTICGDHGKCEDELKICDCASGYAGVRCDIAPALNFTGIVSQAYKNVSTGRTIAERANPCYDQGNDSVAGSYDVASNTQTVPIDGVDSLSNLYIGATVGVRWTSEGDIELLAVGMIAVDAETGEVGANVWPFYVGASLATDDDTCDDKNSTAYDGCYHKLECNDFAFAIPTYTTPGTYRLIIRFNNEFVIQSPVVNVLCNENNCNSAGHGQCNADDSGCACESGWSGDSCAYSLCDVWSFAVCAKDEQGNCGSLGATDYKPKCFNSTCNAVSNATNTNANANANAEANQCVTESTITANNYECSNTHFEGQYCEIPVDLCATYLQTACSSGIDDLCEWVGGANGMCVYKQCNQFVTENECTGGINGTNDTSTFFTSAVNWAIFCEWVDDGSNTYCDRVTCGNQQLPDCENSAVRRPIFDQYSDDPVSICYAWYCDCNTVENSKDSKWKISTASELLSSIATTYTFDTTPLTSQHIAADSLDLFTCNVCSLDCQNGAQTNTKCMDCNDGCPTEISPFRTGVECDQVFWIGSFRVKISYDVAQMSGDDKTAEFEGLIIIDLAYFLSTDTNHISIWQVKPDGDACIVYFRFLFDTDIEDNAQITGGDVMALAAKEISDPTSSAVRGFIMQYIDSSAAYAFCVPTKEECDPSKQLPIMMIFYICAGASFGFVVLFVIIYRIITRGKRQKAYEAKVKEVRQAQLRLMEHHSKARRVGMRDVSKNRAHKIHKAHRKKDKEQNKEIKQRAKEEKKLNKIKEDHADDYHLASGGHGHQGADSQLELEQYRRYSKQQYAESAAHGADPYKPQKKPAYASSAHGQEAYKPPQAQNRGKQAQSVYSRSSRGQSNASENLPIGWKQYYNADGVPYYFNTNSGETTWRHPSKK